MKPLWAIVTGFDPIHIARWFRNGLALLFHLVHSIISCHINSAIQHACIIKFKHATAVKNLLVNAYLLGRQWDKLRYGLCPFSSSEACRTVLPLPLRGYLASTRLASHTRQESAIVTKWYSLQPTLQFEYCSVYATKLVRSGLNFYGFKLDSMQTGFLLA